jgi:16S rRNA (guanine527-N7)-methyltransferase
VTERKLTPRGGFDKGLRRLDRAGRGEFERALAEHADEFGVRLGEDVRARLGEYFEMVSAWNARLHLVAPCPPAEFAVRHVLESLLALQFIEEGAAVVDVGSGAGLPIVPCLLARADIGGLLVESSQRKAVFLRETLARLGRGESARVMAERFEKLEPPEADCLTCRALERFTEVLPHLLAWAARVPVLLLFGGESLRERLRLLGLQFETLHVPKSERRFLFVVRRAGVRPEGR